MRLQPKNSKQNKQNQKMQHGESISDDYPQPLNVLQENVTDALIISFNVRVWSTLPEKTSKKLVCGVTQSPLGVTKELLFSTQL